MTNILLAITLTCNTKIINLTNEWNKQDIQTLNIAKIRCRQKYPNSPCVKKFIKKDINIYNVICGI